MENQQNNTENKKEKKLSVDEQMKVEHMLLNMSTEAIKKLKEGVDDSQLEQIFKKYVKIYRRIIDPPEEEAITCDICFEEEITSQNRFPIQPCGCSTCCLKCVKDHVSEYINNGRVDIPCPVCSKLISNDLLFSTLIDSQDLQDKYSRNSLNSFIIHNKDKTKICPIRECQTAMIISDGNPRKVCPKCKTDFCLNCDTVPFHQGYTCEEYQKEKKRKNVEAENDAKLIEWLKANGAICPRCGLGCQRISGCNWIYCNPNVGGCGAGFCYVCQKEVDHYSPHILKANCSLSPKA